MKSVILLMAGIVLCYSPFLNARTNGSYLGVSLTRPTIHINDMTFENLPYNYLFTGRPAFTSSQDNSSQTTNWALYGGYQFNRYFSIEALYQPLGTYTRSGSNRGLVDPNLAQAAGFNAQTFLTISTTDTLELKSYGLTALGSFPVANYIYLLGKVGAYYWDGKLDRASLVKSATLNKKVNTTESGSGFSPIFGVGLRIDVSRSLSVRGEWAHISDIGGGLSTGKSSANVSSFSALISF